MSSSATRTVLSEPSELAVKDSFGRIPMRVYGAWDSCWSVETRGFSRASCRAWTDRSFWATPPRDRVRPCSFSDVDNCGNVDMRREHLGLDKTKGEQHYARNLRSEERRVGKERRSRWWQ